MDYINVQAELRTITREGHCIMVQGHRAKMYNSPKVPSAQQRSQMKQGLWLLVTWSWEVVTPSILTHKLHNSLRINNSSQINQRIKVTKKTNCPLELKTKAKTENHSLIGAETATAASNWYKNLNST